MNESTRNGGATLARFFLAGPVHPVGEAENAPPMEQLKRDIESEVPSLTWRDVRETLAEKIEEALDISFGEIVVDAWVRSLALARYLDTSRYPPDETVVTHLAEHTVYTKLSPSIDIFLGERKLRSIPVNVTLSLKLEGGIVTIRGGKILELQTGRGQASGALSVGGVKVAEKKLEPVELAGALTFEEGRKLRPAAGDAGTS